MKVLVEGHSYIAENFENKETGQVIDFIHKQPVLGTESGELITVKDGTTNEELIKILINRLQYQNSKFPCRENSIATTKLEEALLWLQKRTADRLERGVEGKHLK